MGGGDEKSKLDAITQALLKTASAPHAGGMRQPQPGAGFGPDQLTKQGYNMQQGQSKGQEVGFAMQNFGTFVHNMVAQHKQNQIRDAASEWDGFNNALEKAQVLAGDPSAPDYQQKVQKMLGEDPWVKANLDPANPKAQKRLKNMYKALNVDLLEGDKDNVHRDGLKKFFKLKEAFNKAKQTQQQIEPAKKLAMFQQGIQKLMQQQQFQAPDPKMQLEAAKLMESQRTHEDELAYRKQAHVDSLDMQRSNLELRRDQMKNMDTYRNASLEERKAHDIEMENLTRQLRQIEAEKAHELGDTSGLKDAVEKGFPINLLAPKDRAAVIKDYSKEGRRPPTPFTPAEQKDIDDMSTQISKIGSWKTIMEGKKDDNKPFGTFWDSMKYKLGYDTPESGLISDFSRERWAAIGGLVKGVRRGDILKDMVQHTPDPWKDSSKLAYTKLSALEANYKLARAVTLQEHGYTIDPVSGSTVADDIKSYTDHLNAAKGDVQRMSQPAPTQGKTYGKGSVPD